MPTWNFDTPQPDDEPVVLQDWMLFEVPSGARHAVGSEYKYGDRESRVTSAIAGDIDQGNASFVTASGRHYELRGKYGMNLDGDYVLNRWLAREGLEWGQLVNRSKELWNETVETARRPLKPYRSRLLDRPEITTPEASTGAASQGTGKKSPQAF